MEVKIEPIQEWKPDSEPGAANDWGQWIKHTIHSNNFMDAVALKLAETGTLSEPDPTPWPETEKMAVVFAMSEALRDALIPDIKLQFNFRSPGADYRPDHQRDISAYINSWRTPYRQYAEKLAAQVPPMNPECRISVCIPVAAHEEHRYIYRTLQSFTMQTIDPGSFEIALFANYPILKERRHDRQIDEGIRATLEEIYRFCSDYPDLNVRCMGASIRGDGISNIGFIRSISTDVVLLRHVARQNGEDHILVRCDSDTRGINPGYLENFLRAFDKNPLTASFAGHTSWSPERFAANPLLCINQIFDEIVTSAVRIYYKQSYHGGPNFAVRAGVYSAVGGYACDERVGEDIQLAKELRYISPESDDFVPVGYLPSARLYTSTRRAEEALGRGSSSIAQWSDDSVGFSLVDHSVRTRNETCVPSDEAAIDGDFILKAEDLINTAISETHRFWPKVTAFSKPVEKALGYYLGLKYEVTGPLKIRITNTDRFMERIHQVTHRGIEDWRRKAGFAD